MAKGEACTLSKTLLTFSSSGYLEGRSRNREKTAPTLEPKECQSGSLRRCIPMGGATGAVHARVGVRIGQVYAVLADGQGPLHHGVCSTWLSSLKPEDPVPCFIRR